MRALLFSSSQEGSGHSGLAVCTSISRQDVDSTHSLLFHSLTSVLRALSCFRKSSPSYKCLGGEGRKVRRTRSHFFINVIFTHTYVVCLYFGCEYAIPHTWRGQLVWVSSLSTRWDPRNVYVKIFLVIISSLFLSFCFVVMNYSIHTQLDIICDIYLKF